MQPYLILLKCVRNRGLQAIIAGISLVGLVGCSSDSNSEPVEEPVMPSVTVNAAPNVILVGETSTVSWTSSNADSCNSDEFETDNQISGSIDVQPDNGNLDLLANSPAMDSGQVQADISSWTDPFWTSEFVDGVIPAHGETDINDNNRISNQIDIGADEF